MIHLEHVTVRYASRSQPTLNNISLHVKRGEFILLTGPSGCGKSTLALSLAGLIPHAQGIPAELTGRVLVDGLDTREHSLPALARHVGIVFQNPATQLFNITVEEEVAFAPQNLRMPPDEVEGRVAWALEATGISNLRHRAVRTLSGGEQQRVAIAATLAARPPVLVLDEPTANLDWEGVDQVTATLSRLHRQAGVTVVVVEHRLAAVAPLATRVILLAQGQVVADGAPVDVLGDKHWLAQLGLRYPWLDRARRIEPAALPISLDGRPPLVALRRVTAEYQRNQPVLCDLDLIIYPREFVALTGPNGAGKSTVARLLAGIIRPRRGKVIWSRSLRRLPIGRRVGLLFQNPLHQLVCDSVAEEVAFGPANYGLETDLMPLLEAADLTTLCDQRPQALSVGQQQRTALAAALALRPRLLILDEPTMGQDWAHLSRLMDYLVDLHHNGQAILLITHDERLVCRYADRVIRLEEGRITADVMCITDVGEQKTTRNFDERRQVWIGNTLPYEIGST